MSVQDSGKAAQPTVGVFYCQEAKGLLEAFGEAVQQLVTLHEQQLLAIVDGDPDAGRFDLLLHYANEKKLSAKYAYLQHLEAHVCSSNI